MKKFECVKGFAIDRCDGDGFTEEECGFAVEVGSVWYDDEEDFRLVGGEVRLETEDDTWIEIAEEDLVAYFKEIS